MHKSGGQEMSRLSAHSMTALPARLGVRVSMMGTPHHMPPASATQMKTQGRWGQPPGQGGCNSPERRTVAVAWDGSGRQVGARSPVSPLSCSLDFRSVALSQGLGVTCLLSPSRNVTISLFYCNDCTGLPLPLSLPGWPDPCPLGHFCRLTALPGLQLVGCPATTPMSLQSLQVVAWSGEAAEVLKLTPVFSQPPSCPRWLGAAGMPAALSVGLTNWRPGCLPAWGGPM